MLLSSCVCLSPRYCIKPAKQKQHHTITRRFEFSAAKDLKISPMLTPLAFGAPEFAWFEFRIIGLYRNYSYGGKYRSATFISRKKDCSVWLSRRRRHARWRPWLPMQFVLWLPAESPTNTARLQQRLADSDELCSFPVSDLSIKYFDTENPHPMSLLSEFWQNCWHDFALI